MPGNAQYLQWGAGYMPMMTHIPMLLHPDPRRLLVICFGTGATAGAGLLHPGTSVDVVDINPAVFEFAPYFEAANHGVARHARARLILDDGRNFLLTTTERYDVITAEPMPPRFAGVVNLYSKEYYQLARAHLRPGGFVVQWLPMHLTTFIEALRILRTMQDVFPETTLWLHSGTGVIVSRRDLPIEIDLDRFRQAYGDDALRADLIRLGVPTPWSFATMHALGPEAIRMATAPFRAITDDFPSLEFHRVGSGLGRDAASFEESRSMQLIQRLRGETPPPAMKGATAEEAEWVASYRRAESGRALAEIRAQWGLGSQRVEEPRQ